MYVTTSSTAAGTTYKLSGRFSFRDNDVFQPILEELRDSRNKTVVFDLAELEFADSFGIGLFVVARDEAAEGGNTLSFINVNGLVAKLFDTFHLNDVLPVGQHEEHLVVSAFERTGNVLRTTLAGRFTASGQTAFVRVMDAIKAYPGSEIVLNMHSLETIDAFGITMMLTAADEASRRKVTLVMEQPNGTVLSLLRMSALDTLATIR